MHQLTEFEALDGIFTLLAICTAAWIGWEIYLRKKRKKLYSQDISPEKEAIIKKNVPLYNKLPDELKRQLKGLVNIFLHEKQFEGCGGLEVTEEIKVTIAAQACFLLLNRKTNYYPKLKFILVYPSAYIAKSTTSIAGMNVVVNEKQARLGESWLRGSLVLAWDHVKMEAKDILDGHNVVLHEFAHQLDQEDGSSNGTPILEQRSNYVSWGRVFAKDFELLRYEVDHHIKDVMDAYGATNPAEFFAVATETFFEKPKQLNKKHPELYKEMTMYYKLDPLTWK